MTEDTKGWTRLADRRRRQWDDAWPVLEFVRSLAEPSRRIRSAAVAVPTASIAPLPVVPPLVRVRVPGTDAVRARPTRPRPLLARDALPEPARGPAPSSSAEPALDPEARTPEQPPAAGLVAPAAGQDHPPRPDMQPTVSTVTGASLDEARAHHTGPEGAADTDGLHVDGVQAPQVHRVMSEDEPPAAGHHEMGAKPARPAGAAPAEAGPDRTHWARTGAAETDSSGTGPAGRGPARTSAVRLDPDDSWSAAPRAAGRTIADVRPNVSPLPVAQADLAANDWLASGGLPQPRPTARQRSAPGQPLRGVAATRTTLLAPAWPAATTTRPASPAPSISTPRRLVVERGRVADEVTARTQSRAASIGHVVYLPSRLGGLDSPRVRGLLAHEATHAALSSPREEPVARTRPAASVVNLDDVRTHPQEEAWAHADERQAGGHRAPSTSRPGTSTTVSAPTIAAPPTHARAEAAGVGRPLVSRATQGPPPPSAGSSSPADDLDRLYRLVSARLEGELMAERERTGGLVDLAWR